VGPWAKGPPLNEALYHELKLGIFLRRHFEKKGLTRSGWGTRIRTWVHGVRVQNQRFRET
jgi:hypothetical protein